MSIVWISATLHFLPLALPDRDLPLGLDRTLTTVDYPAAAFAVKMVRSINRLHFAKQLQLFLCHW